MRRKPFGEELDSFYRMLFTSWTPSTRHSLSLCAPPPPPTSPVFLSPSTYLFL